MILKLVVLNELPLVLAWTITPEDVTAWSLLIGALFLGIVNVIGARAAARQAVAPLAKKIDTIEPLVTKIEGHVNSEKTRTEGEIATLRSQNTLQRETIERLEKATALLAQAKAISDTTLAIAQAASANATMPPAAAPVQVEVVQPPDKPVPVADATKTESGA